MKLSPFTTFFILCSFTLLTCDSFAEFEIPESLSKEQAARFRPFESFYIKGVCGGGDFSRLGAYGVNTIRGYTIPTAEEMLSTLDQVHSLGMKMVVSEWMPHHGENKGNNGVTWDFDYNKNGDQMTADFLAKVNEIGNHPAILMWGLGNEVHLDEPYLRTVNRMSQGIHKLFPLHLTSLTMVNASPEKIDKIQRFAPDLDVLGIQSYSAGAIRGGIHLVETHWEKPFYYSEFNSKGPWNFKKTDWDVAFEDLPPAKLDELKRAYDAIEASKLCLGSTIFIWGNFTVNRPTYFSLLLAEDPANHDTSLLMTPRAEYVAERFTEKPFNGNRAPLLTRLEFKKGGKSRASKAGQDVQVIVGSEDPDGDAVFYKAWFLDKKYRSPKVALGPLEFKGPKATLTTPSTPGSYLIMVYALDGNGGASASTLPLLVE